MAKLKNSYDPSFNLKYSKATINARDTASSKRQKKQKINHKHWSQKQHQDYLYFVKAHPQKFEQAKKYKTFLLMSKHVKTRNSMQCKTHHVKMMRKCNNSISLLTIQQSFYTQQSEISCQGSINITANKIQRADLQQNQRQNYFFQGQSEFQHHKYTKPVQQFIYLDIEDKSLFDVLSLKETISPQN